MANPVRFRGDKVPRIFPDNRTPIRWPFDPRSSRVPVGWTGRTSVTGGRGMGIPRPGSPPVAQPGMNNLSIERSSNGATWRYIIPGTGWYSAWYSVNIPPPFTNTQGQQQTPGSTGQPNPDYWGQGTVTRNIGQIYGVQPQYDNAGNFIGWQQPIQNPDGSWSNTRNRWGQPVGELGPTRAQHGSAGFRGPRQSNVGVRAYRPGIDPAPGTSTRYNLAEEEISPWKQRQQILARKFREKYGLDGQGTGIANTATSGMVSWKP